MSGLVIYECSVIRAATKYKTDANPQKNKGNQNSEAELLKDILQSIHIGFIIATKVSIKTFPYQSAYNQR